MTNIRYVYGGFELGARLLTYGGLLLTFGGVIINNIFLTHIVLFCVGLSLSSVKSSLILWGPLSNVIMNCGQAHTIESLYR